MKKRGGRREGARATPRPAVDRAPRDRQGARGGRRARRRTSSRNCPRRKTWPTPRAIFAKRSAAAAAELAALEKASGEKAAALKKTGEELDAASPGRSRRLGPRLQPVRESVRREGAGRPGGPPEDGRGPGRRGGPSEAARPRSKRTRAWQVGAENKSPPIAPIASARRARSPQPRSESAEHAAVVQDRQEAAKASRAGANRRRQGPGRCRTAVARHQQSRPPAWTPRWSQPEAASTAAAVGRDPVRRVCRSSRASRTSFNPRPPTLTRRVDAARAALRKAESAAAPTRQALEAAAVEQKRRARRRRRSPGQQWPPRNHAQALRTELAEATDELTSRWADRFALAQLKPLSPEQMCWSILEGHRRLRSLPEGRGGGLAKAKPLTGPAAADQAVLRARAIEVEQRTFDKLKGNVPAFVAGLWRGRRPAAERLLRHRRPGPVRRQRRIVNGWIAPAGGNVSERMVGEKDARKAAVDLYLTVLSRPPTDEEAADVARDARRTRQGEARGRAGAGVGTVDVGRVPIQSLRPHHWPERKVIR